MDANIIRADPPATPEVIRDAFGRPIPDRLVPAFGAREWFYEFITGIYLPQLKAIETAGNRPGGEGLVYARVQLTCKRLLQAVKDAVDAEAPLVVCPRCDGSGRAGDGFCSTCTPLKERRKGKGRGWLTREGYRKLPTHLRPVVVEWETSNQEAKAGLPKFQETAPCGDDQPDGAARLADREQPGEASEAGSN